MHNPEYSPANNFVQVHFSEGFTPLTVQPKLGDLIQTKIDNREYFYGLELSARSNSTLDFRKFTILPLFTSLVWFGDYYNIDPISEVDAVQFGRSLRSASVVMPHLTSYRLTPERLKSFLSLDFANILALRGDMVHEKQEYRYASELVNEIRQVRGDTITIGVAGYPQGHPQSQSKEDDIKYLKKKVNAGADFIVTQLCFNASSIIEFVENCRKNGITVPIVLGVFAPENYSSLRTMLRITKVVMAPEQLEQYKKRSDNEKEFMQHSVEVMGKIITEVFASDIGVYGVHLFSMNQFNTIENFVNNVIAKLNTKE